MKTTRLLIDSGSENRVLDCEALLKHLAVCLRGQTVAGCVTIHLDPDGRVFVNGQQVYEPPQPFRAGERHKQPEERELIR